MTMIRHIVLLAFDGADAEVLDTVERELRRLPDLIPEIGDYTVGRDLGLRGGPPTIVVLGGFGSVEAYEAYATHPEHVRVLDDHIRPHVTTIGRAQIEAG